MWCCFCEEVSEDERGPLVVSDVGTDVDGAAAARGDANDADAIDVDATDARSSAGGGADTTAAAAAAAADATAAAAADDADATAAAAAVDVPTAPSADATLDAAGAYITRYELDAADRLLASVD